MTTPELLDMVKELGQELRCTPDGKLILRGPEIPERPALIRVLKHRRAAVLDLLEPFRKAAPAPTEPEPTIIHYLLGSRSVQVCRTRRDHRFRDVPVMAVAWSLTGSDPWEPLESMPRGWGFQLPSLPSGGVQTGGN